MPRAPRLALTELQGHGHWGSWQGKGEDNLKQRHVIICTNSVHIKWRILHLLRSFTFSAGIGEFATQVCVGV